MSARLSVVPRPRDPVVSVIAMSFNQGQFVAECLDSIVAQDHARLDVLVVDHASTDPWSADVARTAAAERGLDFVALDDHGGPGPARNAAIARTRGELVLPVDADNVLLPGAVGRLVEQLLAAPDDVGFVYPRLVYRGRARETSVPDWNLYALLLGNFCDTGGLWDRRCFDPGPGFPPDGRLAHEDWHLALRLARAGVRGAAARERTTLFRRHGFTLSQRANLDPGHYEQVAAAFPERYAPDALAAVKRAWAPAVSVVAPGGEGGVAAQTCGDVEFLAPGDVARGGVVLVADAAPLSRIELVEQLARTFHARPDLRALACFPERGRYPLEPVREVPAGRAVLVAARASGLADAFGDAAIPADPGPLADALADRLGADFDARWWPADTPPRGDGGRSAAGAGTFRLAWSAPTPSARATLEFCAAAAPVVPGAEPPRGPLGPAPLDRPVPPMGARVLGRWFHPDTAERRVAFADQRPPESFLHERWLGWLWIDDRAGLLALRWAGEGMLEPCAGPGEAIAFAEPADIQGLEELVVVRDAEGRPTLAAGRDDPLSGAPRERRLGWIEPTDRHPLAPQRGTVTLGRRRLGRILGPEAHRYRLDGGAGVDPADARGEGAEPVELELGLLSRRPGESAVPLHAVLRDGELAGLVAHDGAAPPRRRRAAAARGALAPLRWHGWASPRERLGLVAWRLRRLARPPPAAAVGDEPVGFAWRDPGPGRLELLTAWHPVTGDCLLCLHPAEARDWGYGDPLPLGYVQPVGPHRWGDFARARPWCSRAGREVRV